MVLAAVGAGDPVAIEIVQSAGAALGNSVGFLVNILDPEAVIVGGGLGLAGGPLLVKVLSHQHVSISTRRIRVRYRLFPQRLGVDAGIIGAAATAFRCFAHMGETAKR